MSHHKKHKQLKHKQEKQVKQAKQLEQLKKNTVPKNCDCNCEQKFYFPLPNIPSQPVNGERVGVNAWFAPGSVQSCCSICSSVKPVYANPCNTCMYDKGAFPINNSSYFTTGQYVY